MNKNIFLIISFSSLLISISRAEADNLCVRFLNTYNACVGSVDGFVGQYENLDQAFEYIQSIYSQIDACKNGQVSELCTCLLDSTEYKSFGPWGAIFTNPSYFESLKMLVSELRPNVVSTESTVVGFCDAYGWDFGFLSQKVEAECVSINKYLYDFGRDKCTRRYGYQFLNKLTFEKILRCITFSLSSCGAELDQLLVIENLLPNPKVIKGDDLIEFANSILSDRTYDLIKVDRSTVFVFGDPHLQTYTKNKWDAIITTCNIKQKVSLMKTSQFEIFGTGVSLNESTIRTFMDSILK